MTKKILSIVLVLLMCVSVLTACQSGGSSSSAASDTSSAASENKDTPLVVGYAAFSEKFSPFFATTAYDQDVATMTSVSLLTTDRVGGIVYNAIEGETIPYNGKDYTYKGISNIKVEQGEDQTVYTINMRDDVKFSDGHVMDADDVIFSMYVLCDPAYTGAATLRSVDIVGLKNYIYNNPKAESMNISAEDIEAELKNPQEKTATNIKNYISDILTEEYQWCGENYEQYEAESQKAFYIDCYGDPDVDYSKMDDEQVIKAVIEQYGMDYKKLASAYAGDETYFDEDINQFAEDTLLSAREEGAADVLNIEGIKKVSDTCVTVTTRGFDAAAIYQIGVTVAPMHYYGNEADYDYENNKFGFPKGDLSSVEAKTTKPMGAGPYKFIKYDMKVVYFEANENYFLGAPKIKNLQFKETDDKDKVPGVSQGTIDLSDPSGSVKVFEEIKGHNSNKELTGDVITTNTVDNLGYGYIGINAATVNVKGEKDSEASKNLRKAFATIFSVYRDVAINSYYGDAADVINYPISNTSWAAPQKSDEGYRVAFSVDAEGKDIYTSDMKEEDKYTAALNAAVGFFKAAGYTYDDASGKFTAAPEGAKMDYEIIIPGDGSGDHPNFAILTNSKAALEKIGITLTINDVSDQNILWDKLDAKSQEMWTAAWGATIDPDMYQVYHSSNIDSGSKSNHYCISSDELDKLIIDARTSSDQSFRKSAYKDCLDIILDWAVEVPIYQRQNCIIMSTERINIDTMTPDITTYYLWYYEIQNIEMK